MAEAKYTLSQKAVDRTSKAVKAFFDHHTDSRGPDNSPRTPVRCFRGITVAGTFADCRYTVGRARVTNDELDATDAKIEVTEFPVGNGLHWEVTATNLAEYTTNTHSVPDGTPVLVYYDFDLGNPSKARYWFVNGGGSLPTGQYPLMNYQMVAQNVPGFDWIRAHPMTDES